MKNTLIIYLFTLIGLVIGCKTLKPPPPTECPECPPADTVFVERTDTVVVKDTLIIFKTDTIEHTDTLTIVHFDTVFTVQHDSVYLYDVEPELRDFGYTVIEDDQGGYFIQMRGQSTPNITKVHYASKCVGQDLQGNYTDDRRSFWMEPDESGWFSGTSTRYQADELCTYELRAYSGDSLKAFNKEFIDIAVVLAMPDE